MTIHTPPLEKHHGLYWIPPLPPHWDDWMGGYETRAEAEQDRQGVELTINGPSWTMMMVELEDEFEEEWKRRLINTEDELG